MLLWNVCVYFRNFFSSKSSVVWAVAQEIRHSIIQEIISMIIIVDSVVFSCCREADFFIKVLQRLFWLHRLSLRML